MYRIAEETDPGAAIMAVCTLDCLLERVIQRAYINDPQVKSLFKDDRLLQTFHAKVNIAYFSGLIPKTTYHDLKLVAQIRNRFAHTIDADIAFTDRTVASLVDKLLLAYEIPHILVGPRWKFQLTIYQLTAMLWVTEGLIHATKPPRLMDLVPLEQLEWTKLRLPPDKVRGIVTKAGAKSQSKPPTHKSLATQNNQETPLKRRNV